MSLVPAAQPDAEKIRTLIWERGYSVNDFARMIGRHPGSVRNVACQKRGKPASVKFLRQIARGLSTPDLRIKVGDISDWAGDDFDDDIESGAETKIPA